jgi:hypothetical protein
LVELSEKYKELRSRPVGMCESVLNIIASASSQLITSALVRLPLNDLFIGKTLNVKDLSFLENDFANKEGCIYYSPD